MYRFLSLCGMLAPGLFVVITVLGGALHPGYNHLTDTISELFSPGAPNKPFLDVLHTLYAGLLLLFGLALVQLVRRSTAARRTGLVGAASFLVMGCLSVMIATVFPQDAWGTTPTFAGEMHIRLSGLIGISSVISMLLLGIWFIRSGTSPGFGKYSFITIGLVIAATGFFVASYGSPSMGLAERLAALVGFQWTFMLSRWMYARSRVTPG